MARRRMFSLDVVDTDAFLDLPSPSQALFFHLGMRADPLPIIFFQPDWPDCFFAQPGQSGLHPAHSRDGKYTAVRRMHSLYTRFL